MTTILILDDRTTNRNIFARLAASLDHGVEVAAFGDPRDALTWLADHSADLVVTDFRMPAMDGAEFTRALRALPGAADVPVVVITAYSDRSYRMRALEAGATDFLLSPVDHSEFLTRARNLLRLRRQQQVIRRRAETLEQELQDSERSREQLLRDSREALVQVIDTVPALISAADRQGRCVLVNVSQARFAGTTPAGLVGHDIAMLFGPDRAARSRLLDALVFEQGNSLPEREEEATGADGLPRIFVTTKAPLRDAQGAVIAVLTTSLDITDRKTAERRLEHMAHYDLLTGLPNRAFLHDRLRRELARGRRGDHVFALLFLDLDRFKAVNDAFGHYLGDQLLRAVARRLEGVLGEGNALTRLGGDEFAILQSEVSGPEDAASLAERIIASLEEPFLCEGQTLSVSASVGITLHPRDGADADELIRNADLAMYRAKAEGRSGWRFFAAAMDERAREAMRIEADLRLGLARGEFLLHFQPQVDLRSGLITGAEALLRWQHPTQGLLRPNLFLPIAEETGLISPINEWVMREACRQGAAWRQQGLVPVRIGVNLSPIQFRRQDVRGLVLRALADSGLDPRMLDLELTEGILMEQGPETSAVLQAMRDLGICISVDDFGTGYSSLNYVKNFPVDRLKIDQSFVRGMTEEPNDAAIVRTMIELAHTLQLIVIAEGVETQAQLEQLRAEGCDEVQGYYFSRPVPPDEFALLLRHGKAVPAAVIPAPPGLAAPLAMAPPGYNGSGQSSMGLLVTSQMATRQVVSDQTVTHQNVTNQPGITHTGANDAGVNDAGANDTGANDTGANDTGANDTGASQSLHGGGGTMEASLSPAQSHSVE